MSDSSAGCRASPFLRYLRDLWSRIRRLKMPLPFVTTLLQQATAYGSRSTVLRPLSWLIAICLAGVIGLQESKSPAWIVSTFALISVLACALFFGAYVFCLVKDRDALRSETYSIQKLAIEKGYIGDSAIGMLEGSRARRALEQTATTEENRQ